MLRNILGGVFPSSSAAVATADDLEKYPIHLKHSSRLDWDEAEKVIVGEWKASWDWARKCLTDVELLSRFSPPTCKPRTAALAQKDIGELLEKNIIELCTSTPRNTCNVFTVVEILKSRRRMIIEPIINDFLLYAGELAYPTLTDILRHTMTTPGAIVIDFASYFNHFPIPPAAREYFVFEFQGVLYQLCVIPTGQRQCPTAAQALSVSLVSKAIQTVEAGYPRGNEEYSPVVADTYSDNVRFCGTAASTRLVFAEFLSLCNSLNIVINDVTDGNPTDTLDLFVTHYTFLGMDLDHSAKTVQLTEKTKDKLRLIIDLVSNRADKITLRDSLRFLGNFVWASRIMDISLAQNYYLIKFIRRRSQTFAELDCICDIWDSILPTIIATANSLLWSTPRLLHTFAITQSFNSLTLFTDSSSVGFGCVLFHPSRVEILAGQWENMEHINVLESRALKVGLQMLPHMSEPTHVLIFVDNTSTIGAFRKSRSSNFCINWLASDCHHILRDKNFAATIQYIHTSRNLADAPSRFFQNMFHNSNGPQRMRMTLPFSQHESSFKEFI